ncbi:MAG: hypothetical protein C5B51_11050 [Terriglobia bacterium]|nr:MAG: hypothetical protein C5B51_11050 [Terriglobia bacterium]
MNWRVKLALHAAERSATAVHQEMARGLSGLATVGATAAFVGVFGNLLGIFNSFSGATGEKTTMMAAIARSLSEATWPTAFGLAVAVTALLGYRYFTGRLADMDAEMRDAIIELPAYLQVPL